MARKKSNDPGTGATTQRNSDSTMAPGSRHACEAHVEPDYRTELRSFLRAKRALISPASVGLQQIGRRRVTGLRREELASIAGVGLTWYTWLEQGRPIQASRTMLQRVAAFLRLSSSDTAYLFSLAGEQAPEIRELTPASDTAIQAILDAYTGGLAYMFDDVFDIRAFNRLADIVYRFDEQDGRWPRNMAWRNFTDPYRRALYNPWPEYAEMMVEIFRAPWAQRKENPRLVRLLQDLLGASDDSKRLWAVTQETGPSYYFPVPLCLDAPGLGTLHLSSVRLMLATNPDWFVMFQYPTDARTAAILQQIGLRQG